MASDLLETVEKRLAPAHTAVMVIDMQNDFCAEAGYVEKVVGKDVSACRAVAPRVMALVQAARARGVPVYWIKANYDPDRLPEGMRVKQQEKSRVVCCGTGSWGGAFYGVSPAPGEAVIEKSSYSAFADSEVERRLRAEGVRTVVFAGVQTNVCVESSLRDAVCKGFYAVLASDCVASHTADLHDATLMNVRFLFGDVLDREAIARIWQSGME
ncbi:MAG: cysteine hydrolase [Xanthobacteraceae bacterium]|nr:cysteine hydrolase [Xanthobacteraceae bacterium]